MSRFLVPVGVACICAGTALVYAALLTRGVFVPGTVLIGIGVVLCAAGAVVEVSRAPSAP